MGTITSITQEIAYIMVAFSCNCCSQYRIILLGSVIAPEADRELDHFGREIAALLPSLEGERIAPCFGTKSKRPVVNAVRNESFLNRFLA